MMALWRNSHAKLGSNPGSLNNTTACSWSCASSLCMKGMYKNALRTGGNSCASPSSTACRARTKARGSQRNASGLPRYMFLENWSRTMISAKRPEVFSRHSSSPSSAALACMAPNRFEINWSNVGSTFHHCLGSISSNQKFKMLAAFMVLDCLSEQVDQGEGLESSIVAQHP